MTVDCGYLMCHRPDCIACYPRKPNLGRVPRAFIDAILHGDDEHRAWLREAADCWNRGEPVPCVR